MPRTKKPDAPVDKVKKTSKAPIEDSHPDLKDRLLIPSGSTLLNLGCSDQYDGAFAAGTMVNIIGDSSAGKTLLAMTLLAECANLEDFDDYRFIYDDVEIGNHFNIENLFGKRLARRIEPPNVNDDDTPKPSDTIQDWRSNLTRLLKEGKPFIYILDSFDSLTSDEERDLMERIEKAREKGTDPPASYGAEKAKIGGRIIGMNVRDIWETDSFLIIISQTRDNLNPMSFQKKTRSGGNALKFYASHEMWLTKLKSHQVTKNKLKRKIGVESLVKITKNRLTGKEREVQFPIYYDYGLDDIGSCIEFLQDSGAWGGTKSSIDAKTFNIKTSKQKIIEHIEKNDLYDELQEAVEEAWLNIEESVKLNRKKRYR